MNFERRDFLKVGTMSMATALATPAFALYDDSTSKSKGELEGGSSWLRLEGQLKAGHMVIEARSFEEGRDRTVIMRSKLDTKGDSIDLYSGMFSYDHEKTIFAVFSDNYHSTSIVLSDTDDPKIGRLVAWNDTGAPTVSEINKEKFMDSGNLNESVRDPKGTVVDVLGKRKPPAFTWQELEELFGDEPALLQFMRGNRSRHHPAKGELQAFGCHMIITLPSSTLTLAWQAR